MNHDKVYIYILASINIFSVNNNAITIYIYIYITLKLIIQVLTVQQNTKSCICKEYLKMMKTYYLYKKA